MGNLDRSIFTDNILSGLSVWLPRGWVWRKLVPGPQQTLLTVMDMAAFGNEGYRAALRDIFDDMHRSFGWGDGAPTPSLILK